MMYVETNTSGVVSSLFGSGTEVPIRDSYFEYLREGLDRYTTETA